MCIRDRVNTVGKSPAGLAINLLGTSDHCMMKLSPPFNSTRKKRMLRTISAYVTIGKVRRCVSSSPIGNMFVVLQSLLAEASVWLQKRNCEMRERLANSNNDAK